jgi:hypothetical protein
MIDSIEDQRQSADPATASSWQGERQRTRTISPDKSGELERRERVIRAESRSLKSAPALKEIRDLKLYRGQFRTFEAYVRAEWGWCRSYVFRLIRAAELVERVWHPLSDKIPLPQNESQVRPLARLSIRNAQRAWKEVVRRAGKSRISAALVEEVVREITHRVLPRSRDALNEGPPSLGDLTSTQREVRRLLAEASRAVAQGNFGRAQQRLLAAQVRVEVEAERTLRAADR